MVALLCSMTMSPPATLYPACLPRGDVYAWRPPPTVPCGALRSVYGNDPNRRTATWSHETCIQSPTHRLWIDSCDSEDSGSDGEMRSRAYNNDEATTLFRRWTVGDVIVEQDEEVPGLRAAFRDAGMDSQCATAEKWCVEMGAAFLYEVLENFDELLTELNLSRHEFSPPPKGNEPQQQQQSSADAEAKEEQLRCALQKRWAMLERKTRKRGISGIGMDMRMRSKCGGQYSISPVKQVAASVACVVLLSSEKRKESAVTATTGAACCGPAFGEHGEGAPSTPRKKVQTSGIIKEKEIIADDIAELAAEEASLLRRGGSALML